MSGRKREGGGVFNGSVFCRQEWGEFIFYFFFKSRFTQKTSLMGFQETCKAAAWTREGSGYNDASWNLLFYFYVLQSAFFLINVFLFSINKRLTFFERRTEGGYNRYVDISSDPNQNPIYRISTSYVLYRCANIKQGAISSFATLKHLLRDPEIPGCNYSDIINMQ